MDSGRFESVSKPYLFHQVMRGLFVPLRLATDARQLELVTDLDPCIDKVGLFFVLDVFVYFYKTRHMAGSFSFFI
jgi:hypothetical protein